MRWKTIFSLDCKKIHLFLGGGGDVFSVFSMVNQWNFAYSQHPEAWWHSTLKLSHPIFICHHPTDLFHLQTLLILFANTSDNITETDWRFLKPVLDSLSSIKSLLFRGISRQKQNFQHVHSVQGVDIFHISTSVIHWITIASFNSNNLRQD